MTLVSIILVYLVIAATTVWIASFAPRFYAAERGIPVLAMLKDPVALAKRAVTWPIPLISFAFWKYLWRSRTMLEFIVALIAVSSAWRAGLAFLKTLAAVKVA